MEKILHIKENKSPEFLGEREGGEQNQTEIIALADTHNDLEAIIRNLRLHNVIGEDGEWKEGVKNVRIIHTGDVINKEHPDEKSLEYIFHLKKTAPEDCSVEILAGNHEIEYLMDHSGKKEEGLGRSLMTEMSLLSHLGPVLFLHGHPSRRLLKEILSYGSLEDGLNAMNEQFHQAITASMWGDNGQLKRFSFKKKDIKGEDKPYQKKIVLQDYYKEHGKEVEGLLLKLGIEVVVHGHASQQSGVQTVGEFKEFMPKVTFINNDVSVSKFKKLDPGETAGNEWGSTKITMKNNKGASTVSDMVFVNKKTYNNVYNKLTD